jgi:hypothetical protein
MPDAGVGRRVGISGLAESSSPFGHSLTEILSRSVRGGDPLQHAGHIVGDLSRGIRLAEFVSRGLKSLGSTRRGGPQHVSEVIQRLRGQSFAGQVSGLGHALIEPTVVDSDALEGAVDAV